MSRYSVGDKVKVRSDLVMDVMYGNEDLVEEMLPFVGTVATISTVLNNGKYLIRGCARCWYWTNEMFDGLYVEPVKEEVEG